jgi:hypothetical protein
VDVDVIPPKQKKFKKGIAFIFRFDIFPAPRRSGRAAGQHVCGPITDSQQGQD